MPPLATMVACARNHARVRFTYIFDARITTDEPCWDIPTRQVHGPRISLSFAASDHSYQVAEPYFDAAELPYPTLERRVCLAAAQMLCYAGNGRFELSCAAIKKYRRAFRRGRTKFAKQYRYARICKSHARLRLSYD